MIAHLHCDRQTILYLHCYLHSKALHWDFLAKFCTLVTSTKAFVGGKKCDEEKRF